MENLYVARDNLKDILKDVKRSLKPQIAIDEKQFMDCNYQFEGKLLGIEYAGQHNLPQENLPENAFIYLLKDGQNLGVITTENGFVKEKPFWQIDERNVGSVPYVDDETAVAFYTPSWDLQNGQVSESHEAKGNKYLNQVKIYHAKDEDPYQVLNDLYGKIYHVPSFNPNKKKLSRINLQVVETKDNERGL